MNTRTYCILLLVALMAMVLLPADTQAGEVLTATNQLGLAQNTSSDVPQGFVLGMFRMIGGLLLCLGLFAAGIYAARRYMPQSSRVGKRRRLQLREKLHISSKMSATLIAVDNREFLIATSGDSVTVVPTYSLNSGSFEDSLEDAYGASEVQHG